MHTNTTDKVDSIITQRLYLRRLTMADSQQLFTYRSDPLVYEYQIWRPKCLTEIQTFITSQLEIQPNTPNTWYQLAVCDRGSDILIGDCGLHFLDRESCQVEVGFTICPDYQKQGYATEALGALLGYLFMTLNKHRVFASVDPRNIRSVRLLERVGMRKEAHFYQSVRMEKEWTDDAIFAILAAEWFMTYRPEAFA